MKSEYRRDLKMRPAVACVHYISNISNILTYNLRDLQYTVHCTWYTVHGTLYTVHKFRHELHTVHSTLYTVQGTQYTRTQYTVHGTDLGSPALFIVCRTTFCAPKFGTKTVCRKTFGPHQKALTNYMDYS